MRTIPTTTAARALHAALLLVPLAVARAQDDAPAAEVPFSVRVNHAVDRACANLLQQQEAEGGFVTTDKVHPLGRTSLALLALLHAGNPHTEPQVARAIDYLVAQLDQRRATRTGGEVVYRSTYETGITLMLLHALGKNPRYTQHVAPLARFLIDHVDAGEKMWGYPEGARDLSNSQYAMLGLRAVLLCGIEVDGLKEALHVSLQGVLRTQQADGGFAYQPQRLSSGSMTVAGLAMIRIAEEHLERYAPARRDLKSARAATARAQQWLEKNFTVRHNPEGRALNDHNLHYYLYGLERYAALFGLAQVAQRDWYREGALHLLETQSQDGSWGRLEDTCFAILFLRKATLTYPSERERAPAAALPERPPELRPAADVRAIRTWLLAGPFEATPGQDDALDIDPIREAQQRPKRGAKAGKERWIEHEAQEDLFDLIPALVPGGGRRVDDVVFYAAAYLTSEHARAVELWVAADDGVKVFLDGALVFTDHHHDLKQHLRATLALPAGRSLLLVKLENLSYYARLRVQVTDAEGQPVPGLSWSTAPR